jgi:hypothetical protein
MADACRRVAALAGIGSRGSPISASDQCRIARSAFGPIRRGASEVLDRRHLRGAYDRGCSRSRALVGWVDRYIVDGVLNVLSAWTLTAGDDLRTMQSGPRRITCTASPSGLLVLLIWVATRTCERLTASIDHDVGAIRGGRRS